MWDIGVHGGDEWERYLDGGHTDILEENYCKLYPDLEWLPEEVEQELDNMGAHLQKHEERCEDEFDTLFGVLHQDRISSLLQRFPALQEICIVNGAFEIRKRTLRKTGKSITRNTLDLIPRGDNLFSPDLDVGRLGVYAFTRAVEGLSALERPWKLEIDAIDYTFFTPEIYPEGFEAKLGKLTSLTLSLSYWRGGPFEPEGGLEEKEQLKEMLRGGIFQRFLRSLHALRSLSLSLHTRTAIDPSAAASICDILPLEDWAGLRELSLSNIDTTGDDFILLMRNHASTLKKLHLKDVRLVPNGSWTQVLKAVQPVLKLNSATYEGNCLYGVHEEKYGDLLWWHDDDLSLALAKYLTNGG